MKRIIWIGLVLITAAACRKVTPEERITAIADYFNQHEDSYAASIGQYEDTKRTDYLSLTLGKDLGCEEIWSVDTETGSSLLADFPGRESSGANDKGTVISLISAPIDDPWACATVLNVMKAFKSLRISPRNSIRTLFYDAAKDSLGHSVLDTLDGDFREAREVVTFNIVLTSRDTLPFNTFVIEDRGRFVDKVLDIVPPYLAPLGDYDFVKGTYPNPDWPMKTATYRYHVDIHRLQQEAAAVAAFSMLLN